MADYTVDLATAGHAWSNRLGPDADIRSGKRGAFDLNSQPWTQVRLCVFIKSLGQANGRKMGPL